MVARDEHGPTAGEELRTLRERIEALRRQIEALERPGDEIVALIGKADANVATDTVGAFVVQRAEFEPTEGAAVTFVATPATVPAGVIGSDTSAADRYVLVPVGGRFVVVS